MGLRKKPSGKKAIQRNKSENLNCSYRVVYILVNASERQEPGQGGLQKFLLKTKGSIV